jgi:hypothetical protein
VLCNYGDTLRTKLAWKQALQRGNTPNTEPSPEFVLNKSGKFIEHKLSTCAEEPALHRWRVCLEMRVS